MMSQMNVRIDEQLRVEGNQAFEEVGWSPSQATRALWGYAARNRRNPRKLKEIQSLLEGCEPRPVHASRVQRAAQLVKDSLAELGVDVYQHEPTPVAELKEEAFLERWTERGLL